MKRAALDKNWFFYESDDSNLFSGMPENGKTIDLPHDFIISKPRHADAVGSSPNAFFDQGQGIYCKMLEICPDWENGHVLLDVDGAYMNLEVVLNGELLALHPHGYTPFQVELTKALRFDGRKNRLKLITQSRQPSTRWYSGGGLYRDVCMWVGGPVCIGPWDIFVTTPEVSEKRATVKIAAEITGTEEKETVQVLFCVLDEEGVCVSQKEQNVDICGKTPVIAELSVDNPLLWDLDNPYLYSYKIIVKKDGKELDVSEDTFGIRKIEADAEHGFRLNGKPLKLKGGCVHHDNGFLGACAYPKAEERKMKILKSVGFNTVRISHYPPSLALLKICDRLGMLLMDEAFDVWRLGKRPLDYHLYFEDWWERDIEYMVRRDRNHPCVITYSIGNEIGERDGSNHGAEYSAKLAAKVREFDSTRFVTSALCGIFPEMDEEQIQERSNGAEGGNFAVNLIMNNEHWNEKTKEFCEPLDIVGYNYLRDIYESGHELFPERVMCATETHALPAYEYWKKVEELPYVIGDCIWAAVDYLGEVGVGKVYWENDHEPFRFMTGYPWRTSWQSDIDLTGEQRPQSVYREIMWGRTEKSGIFTTHPRHYGENCFGTAWRWADVHDSWNFDREWIGKPVKTEVYCAGDEVEFLLNGRSLGKSPVEELTAFMDIAYEPGTLTGVVFKDGKEISRCTLITYGEASMLELIPEEESFLPDGKDLMYVRILLKDKDGNRLADDQREIRVSCEGAGTFLAVGSGNPCTEDFITAPCCHLYRGTAIIILKSAQPGETKLTVHADGVESAVCTVTAKE